jgi:homoserine O-acetyltransferase/O-succinyltransferase
MRLALLLGLCCAALHGQQDPLPTEADWVVRDFAFRSGQHLPELKLHYLTLGTPLRDAAGHVNNAVLLLHATNSSSAPFLASGYLGALFLPGQELDAQKYFLILPDAIGHGDSSKPSDGLHAKFPAYDYEDMVLAQYRLVREHLGIDHLRLVLGSEMGGMQTWLWGARYPEFMDALMPLGCTPAPISGRQRVYRDMVIDAIQTDPEWKGGEYTAPPRGLLAAQFLMYLMTQSAGHMERSLPTPDIADAQFQAWRRRALRLTDANDLLYQFHASKDYDPHIDKIQAKVLAVNFADDELNPPEAVIAPERARNGRFVLIPASEETRGAATGLRARVWREYVAELLR